MSEFKVIVVELGDIEKHPNADTLGITKVWDYPVIVRLGEFVKHQKAVYVPVDSLVPKDDPRWAFLDGHNRIKAKRLRGVFSMGLLTAANPEWEVGQDVRAELRIEKWEPRLPEFMGGESEKGPVGVPEYTDIEGLRRWPAKLQPGEEVIITEKIHGSNGRFVFIEGRLFCGSHHQFKKNDERSAWWRAAKYYDLEAKLATKPGLVFYAEIFGKKIQKYDYGVPSGEVWINVFDVYDVSLGRYLDFDVAVDVTSGLGLPFVPVLYRGPWKEELRGLAEGKTTTAGKHTREGIVIRLPQERYDLELGRFVLKLHGEGYLTEKDDKP